MRILKYFFLLLILLFGISFAYLNATQVTVQYYFGSSNMPLSLLLVLTLILGILVGLIMCVLPLLRLKRKNYRLHKRVQLAEKEVENLRAIPLKDEH